MMHQGIKTEKYKIRADLRQKRQMISETDRLVKQQLIMASLTALPVYQQARHLACYWATKEEVATDGIIQHIWQNHKTVYLPVIQNQENMAFYVYQQTEQPELKLKLNVLNFYEPLYEPETEAYTAMIQKQLDIILVPLVGFDAYGNRLGMGKGYYDRYLQDTSAVTLGLAYDVQYVDRLPVEPWDVRLDYVITEKQVYQFIF